MRADRADATLLMSSWQSPFDYHITELSERLRDFEGKRSHDVSNHELAFPDLGQHCGELINFDAKRIEFVCAVRRVHLCVFQYHYAAWSKARTPSRKAGRRIIGMVP